MESENIRQAKPTILISQTLPLEINDNIAQLLAYATLCFLCVFMIYVVNIDMRAEKNNYVGSYKQKTLYFRATDLNYMAHPYADQ